MTPDDIAEKVLGALQREGGLDPFVCLSGPGAPERAPFVLIRPEDTGQTWALHIQGPMDSTTPEGIASAAVALGYATEAEPNREEHMAGAAGPRPGQVACWHTEPGSPCDWHICRQPNR